MVFTIGKIKDAARFEVVKEELGNHFATQFWSDAADVVRAFEILGEPVYKEPEEPDLPKCLLKGEKVTNNKGEESILPGEVDPEYESKAQRYRMLINRYSHDHDEWKSRVKHWKDNKSRMFAIFFNIVLKTLCKG